MDTVANWTNRLLSTTLRNGPSEPNSRLDRPPTQRPRPYLLAYRGNGLSLQIACKLRATTNGNKKIVIFLLQHAPLDFVLVFGSLIALEFKLLTVTTIVVHCRMGKENLVSIDIIMCILKQLYPYRR